MIKLYDTRRRQKVDFEPVEPGKVSMYVCGPTVYNRIHIGNARTFISFDMIRRYLSWRGFDVTFVQNVTDVDDKIIRRAAEEARTAAEVAAHPEPYIVGMRTVALEPSTEHRRKDSDKRLIAGVIERYGEPEERMCANYRRYVREYPLVGQALRSMAAEGRPALIHCVNGKDRTGVLCATLLRATGADEDAIMEDYLRVNADHADLIAEEAAHLDGGMTDHERAILLSFLEARPAYLRAYFDEIDRLYGSFATYLREGLHLTPEAIESLRALVA